MTYRKFYNVYSSKVELSGTSLIITVAGVDFATLPNLTKFNLIICQKIPAGANTSLVVLTDGTTKIEAYNLSGNYLRADQIKCRRGYPMVYGNDPQHISMQRLLYNTVYTEPVKAKFNATDKKGA